MYRLMIGYGDYDMFNSWTNQQYKPVGYDM